MKNDSSLNNEINSDYQNNEDDYPQEKQRIIKNKKMNVNGNININNNLNNN